jgi:hypothetical protein
MRIIELGRDIYAVVDERGRTWGTGSMEVCEWLVTLANGAGRPEQTRPGSSQLPRTSPEERDNIRSAIRI